MGGGRAPFLELVGPGLLAVAVFDFGNSVLCHLAIKLAEVGFPRAEVGWVEPDVRREAIVHVGYECTEIFWEGLGFFDHGPQLIFDRPDPDVWSVFLG